jgi:hypothetical protein
MERQGQTVTKTRGLALASGTNRALCVGGPTSMFTSGPCAREAKGQVTTTFELPGGTL